MKVAVIAVLMLLPCAAQAGPTLYDGANPLPPNAQGWLTYGAVPSTSFFMTGGGRTILDTTLTNSIYAGFHNHDAALNGLLNPAFPLLDRTRGFSIALDVRVTSEAHANPNRAGFSVIVLASDLQGIEIGFWTDRVWAQSGSTFTHAEEALIDVTALVRRYELTVFGSTYAITADGTPLLSGPLRNYSAAGAPYDRPNFVFFGDDTSSAAGRSEISLVAVSGTPPTIVAGGPVTRQQGGAAGTVVVATVSDAETVAGSLAVTTTSVPAGLTLIDLANTVGTVTASIAASCSATLGANSVGLQVTDARGFLGTATLSVNVAPNTTNVVLVPDGRLTPIALPASASLEFVTSLRSQASYALELVGATGTTQVPAPVGFQPSDDCATGTLVMRETTLIDPPAPNARRASFTTLASGLHRFRITNAAASSLTLSVGLAETTLFSPAWSTNGTYDTYYSFQNTTGATINATLTLLSTDGTATDSASLIIPASTTVSADTASLATPRNATGTARVTHDAPPGALLAEAAVANFSLTPAYVQPVKFVAVRESR